MEFMPVNVTDQIVILEQDKTKLSQAIQTAITAVLEKYRQTYLPGVDTIPSASVKIKVENSLSKAEKRNYRNRVRLCQVLEHYQGQTLDAEFLEALEAYLRQPVGEGKAPSINDTAVAEGLKFAQGAITSFDPMRFPARMIFLTLVSMRVLLLPLFGVPTFIPDSFGPEGHDFFLDLLHPALRELLLTLRPRFARKTTIDWSLTEGSKATNNLADVGSDYLDWKLKEGCCSLPGYALSVGVATTWHDVADVKKADIEAVYSRASMIGSGNRAVKLYLNCLYLCRQSEAASGDFFSAVSAIPYYRIYTLEYKIWAKREVRRRQYAGGDTIKSHDSRYNKLRERLRTLSGAYIQGKEDDQGFVASLRGVRNRRLILDFEEFQNHCPIPLEHGFDWRVKMEQWRAAFTLFKEYKNYETESSSLSPFTAFFLYMGVYLPAWFLKNPDSGLKFPEKITDFKGAIYFHRPESIPLPTINNPPLTFRQFNDVINEGNKQESIAKCARVVRDFFAEIITETEILGIPPNWPNPVKDSAVPNSGGRPWGCTKADIPVPVTFLTLLYCYRLLDCMNKVNATLLGAQNVLLSNHLYRFVGGDRHKIEDTNTLRNLRDLTGFDLDTSGVFDGTKLNLDIVPKRLFTPRVFPIKGRGATYLLDTGPLEHIIVMVETGLRGQSVQWLDTEFDCDIKAKNIAEDGIYPLRVNTDKAKDCAWPAYVAGRVINVLKARRKFRETLAGEIFDQDIYYEGNPNSKWGKFKPVFSTNVENGYPHNDSGYSELFKFIFHALQGYIDILKLNYISSVPDVTSEFGFKVAATPHSARRAVVMELITYLPAEYIGKYITGQTPRTVAYYAAANPDSFNRVENHQKAYQIIDGARRAVDTSRGPEVTEPHKPSSGVAEAFKANTKQAMHDFAPMCTAIFEQNSTGSDMVREGRHQKLAFEATHICPFGSECPPERKKQGLVRRCNFCDFALRTVDHLPAIASEMRNLSEKCHEIDIRLDKSGGRMSDAQRGVCETQRREIAEDLFGLMVADYVLRERLKHLKDEYRKNPEYFCFTPDIIIKNLEAAPFPRRDEGLKYTLSRLKEAKTYVSLNDGTIKANIAKFSRWYMSKSDDLNDLFKDDDLDQTAADAYSFVHTYLSTRNLTLDEFVIDLQKPVGDIAGSGTVGRDLLPGIASLVAGGAIGISP
jgi:hypothetical protein